MTALPRMPQLGFSMLARPAGIVVSLTATMLGRADLPSRNEIAALRPATRVLIAGLTAFIVLVVAVTAIAVATVEISSVNVSDWLGTRGLGSKGIEARAASGFENIVQRPLFSRNRSGLVPVEPAPVAPPPPIPPLDQGITLRGVFMNEGVAKAFLVTTQNPLGVWVSADGEIEGWRLVAVASGQIVLEGQNEKLVIPLNVTGK